MYHSEELIVYVVKPIAVNVQGLESIASDLLGDTPIALDLGEVTHTAE